MKTMLVKQKCTELLLKKCNSLPINYKTFTQSLTLTYSARLRIS